MNSKLREVLTGFYTKIYWDMRKANMQPPLKEDYAEYEAEAEKAIRKAVAEEMLELLGKPIPKDWDDDIEDFTTWKYYDGYKVNANDFVLGYNRSKAELRQKIKEWSEQ